MQLVLPWGDVCDRKLAAGARGGVPGRRHYRDDGAHRWMNVAEDPHDPRQPEGLRFGSARLVQPCVERLPGEVGKRVVIDRVEIRKIDGAAHRNREHVWAEM